MFLGIHLDSLIKYHTVQAAPGCSRYQHAAQEVWNMLKGCRALIMLSVGPNHQPCKSWLGPLAPNPGPYIPNPNTETLILYALTPTPGNTSKSQVPSRKADGQRSILLK